MTVLVGGTGEKDRSSITHESYLLMANSQTDMEEWVRAIRRVIWAPLGGGGISKQTCRFKFGAVMMKHTSLCRCVWTAPRGDNAV